MPKPREKKATAISLVLRSMETKEGPLTLDDCKGFVGWSEEPEDGKWGAEYALKDLYGKKIRLLNNPSNRPFKRPLADRYAAAHLQGTWELNLETVVIADNENVLQGQHRLTGLVLAEQARQINPKRWGTNPLVYQTAMGFGVSSSTSLANTFDTGKGRSLGDVIYRHHKFPKKVSDKKQRGMSNILSGAIRLVWLRVGGKQIAFAKHFPHPEALEFYGKHPNIQKAVTEICRLDEGEEGNDQGISSLLSLPYAVGLMYLMARAESWEKAGDFWTAFASGEGLRKGSAVLSLRQLLTKMETGSGGGRDAIVGAVVKAWLFWIAKKPAGSKDVRVVRKKVGEKFTLAEFPRIGGIDSPVEVKAVLSDHQLLVLSVLKSSKEELDYNALREATGLQTGTLATAIMQETKQGKSNPDSLMSRKLVDGNEYEPEKGQKGSSYWFKLSQKGIQYVS